jgi:hypothetical protein
MSDRIQSFEAFWPYYVGEHRNPTCRGFHYLGTTLLFPVLAAGLLVNPLLLLLLPVVGYGGAWFGHFVIEKNRPATFTYPLWSLRGDFKMYGLALRGKMADEVTRLYGSPAPAPDAPLRVGPGAVSPAK